jgi:hypothetical protein
MKAILSKEIVHKSLTLLDKASKTKLTFSNDIGYWLTNKIILPYIWWKLLAPFKYETLFIWFQMNLFYSSSLFDA